MSSSLFKKAIVGAVVISGFSAGALSAQSTAPTYMQAVAPSVSLTPFLSAGDFVGSYQIPGIPDGVGVYKDGKRLTILTNHEWSATNTVASARNSAGGLTKGAFITQLTYNIETGAVTKAKDLANDVVWYDYTNKTYGAWSSAPAGAPATDSFGTLNHASLINRFCSATLAPAGAFYDAKSKLGFEEAVYLTGEEGSDESRAFAVNMQGQMVQLPGVGLAAWENIVPVPSVGKTTALMASEDGSATDSQLWMYVGQKTKKGQWFEKAGLTNGSAYVLSSVASAAVANDNEIRAKYGKGTAFKVGFSKVDNTLNGKAQNELARSLGIELSRVEDGHFDPKNPNDFYFVTTESNKDPKATAPNPATPTVTRDGGALWKLSFADLANPAKGGTLTMLLDGSEVPYLSKPDNIAIDDLGNILIQEDPGNNAQIARVVAYRIKDGKLGVVAKFKDDLFTTGRTGFITQDEESSGVVDVTSMLKKGKGDKSSYYMLVAQIHATPALARPDIAAGNTTLANAVEGGQWYIMEVPNWAAVYNQ